MAFGGAGEHLARLRLQLGRPVLINEKPFKCRGYFANRLALNLAHEPHLVPVVRRIMTEREGPVVDVGANLGQTLAKVLLWILAASTWDLSRKSRVAFSSNNS